LLNARMVNSVFDDLNPETRTLWDYPDGPWDPERNTREFVAAMTEWRAHGLLSFTVNLQGGSPHGYSDDIGNPQPWINSAFGASGDLRPDYMARLRLVLDRADELGMATIVGLFTTVRTSGWQMRSPFCVRATMPPIGLPQCPDRDQQPDRDCRP
jgi:hypothetical protein